MTTNPELWAGPAACRGYSIRYASMDLEDGGTLTQITIVHTDDSVTYSLETTNRTLGRLIKALFQAVDCPEELISLFLKNYTIDFEGVINLDELAPGGVAVYSDEALATAERLFTIGGAEARFRGPFAV